MGIEILKSFDSKIEAIRWENFIKGQKNRRFIEKLIDSEENELEQGSG